MEFFNDLVLNLILVIFPIIIYMLYRVITIGSLKTEGFFVFDLMLLLSFYLLIKFGTGINDRNLFILANLPLFLAYIKKRRLLIFFLSFLLIYYYNYYFEIAYLFLVGEYFLFYLFFCLANRKAITNVVLINGLIAFKAFSYAFTSSTPFISSLFLNYVLILVFYLMIYVSILIFSKIEKYLVLFQEIKKIEEEKELQKSLFMIAHEIKNPIAVCKGYLSMYDYNNKEHGKKYIPIVRQEIERTLNLLDDFASFTKMKLNIKKYDLGALINDVIDALKILFETYKIELIVEMEERELFLEGDAARLKQVFINIFKNAVEALVDIKDKKIVFVLKETKKDIIIRIIDNGEGMSPETLENIMTPFWTTKEKGTGLGVPLSKNIIVNHGGRINYFSKLKKGTTVEIILPNKKII